MLFFMYCILFQSRLTEKKIWQYSERHS